METIVQIPFSSFLDPTTILEEDKKKYTNIRKRYLTKNLDELKRSIKTLGVQEPLLCRILPDGKYEIVQGQRRYLAVRELREEGLKVDELPCIVRKLTDIEARVLSAVDDMLHSAADSIDKGEQVKILMTELGDMKKVADQLGWSEDTLDLWMSSVGYNKPIAEEESKQPINNKESTIYFQQRVENNLKNIQRTPKQTETIKYKELSEQKETSTEATIPEVEKKKFNFFIQFEEEVYIALWSYSKSKIGEQATLVTEYVNEAVKEKLKKDKLLII